ncbi:calcium channel MID1 [Blastomyces parvus]|uniref:Calcium channel MID1 n=1 Tax=Blastomyces parvus TaxID=2060905 RepID=A0A2B7WR73_9EURO|nr:calcium channel MID1 [Blastomyces parvus]
MSCLKLSPLQARFAASLAATLFIIIVLYFVLSNPSLAYAIDVDSITHRDHNHPISRDIDLPPALDGLLPDLDRYLADPVADILRRAPGTSISLGNNAPEEGELDMGATLYFWIPEETLAGPKSDPSPGLPGENENEFLDSILVEEAELRRRNDTLAKRATKVYISATTCFQPAFNATKELQNTGPPQLQLKISTSGDIQQPDPGGKEPDLRVITFDGGYAGTVVDAEGEIHLAVSAPKDDKYFGSYKFEIAASIDKLFHEAESNIPYLFFVDGDSESALLQTKETTTANPDDEIYKKWMNLDPPPFTMFAHDMKDKSILGVQKSYCGLKANAQIHKDDDNVQVSMTTRGRHHKPKEQFYIRGLNSSSSYYGFLAIEGNSTNSGKGVVGGGGKVWKPTNFTTKTENNCALLHDLEFCSEVAYAVPSNPSINHKDLAKIYDTHAKNLYKNFSRSLAQIPCNTSDTSLYSLARNCTDCAAAYKQWLCAVTIPRCADYSSTLPFLRPRNTAQKFPNNTVITMDSPLRQMVLSNSSRNPLIDEEIKPGPYKEVLPCQDLCHELVQSCPAALGFSCPTGKWLNDSYGVKSPNGDITCSYFGAAYFLSGGGKFAGGGFMLVLGGVVGFWMVFWML